MNDQRSEVVGCRLLDVPLHQGKDHLQVPESTSGPATRSATPSVAVTSFAHPQLPCTTA